jgi:hypothetical protein
MARLPQGIAGLNVGDTQNLLGQMQKDIGSKPKTLAELAEFYGQGLLGKGPGAKNFIPPVKSMEQMYGKPKTEGRKVANFFGDLGLTALEGGRLITGLGSAFTNPAGNIIGDFLNQETPEEFNERASAYSGPEVFLPEEGANVGVKGKDGKVIVPEGLYDAFDTEDGGQGQERLVDAQFPDGLTIQDKINETIENNKSTADASNTMVEGAFLENDEKLGNAVEGANNPAKQATVGALSEFLAQARPGIKPQTYGEYIKEFGDVTGLDVSGDPDNKVALMSFGLALMQNRAGKDFNVSKILTSVGEAGEAAMPDFRRAVAKAETIRAKAGEYALGKTEKDKAKAMNRNSYVIIPKQGGLASSILKNNGEFTRLNSYELNNLIDNKKFNDEYEIIDSSVYTDMTKSLITAQNKDQKKVFLEKPSSIPLFSGSKTTFDVFYANPNNPTGMKSKVINPELAVNAIQTLEKSLTRRVDKFRDIAKLINVTDDIDAASQVASFGKQLAISFGIKLGDGETTPLKQLNALLIELKARNAADILGESGKTISDNDRNLVDSIVGSINPLKGDADIDLLKAKLGRLFKQITSSKRDEIDESYSNLSKFGITVDRKNAATAGAAMVRGEDGVFRFNI